MTFSKKIFYFVVVFFSFAIISCSNPGNTPVIPIQTGTNGANPTSPTTPANPETPAQPESPTTPTNPETPATTQPENPATPTTPESPNTPETPTPQYKWLLTHWEQESVGSSSNLSTTTNSSTDYSYSFYNTEFNHCCTSISLWNYSCTLNGNTSNQSSNKKFVRTYSKTGNDITRSENVYVMEGSTWVLDSEAIFVYYKYDSLMSSSYSKIYPAGTETTTNYTIELLDNNNGIERYKVTFPSTLGIYYVYEFSNNRIQKQITYYSETDKKMQETDYIYPNNSILQEKNIELVLTQTKSYNNDEQILAQMSETLESVTLNANNTITVILGNSANTSTNYSYSTEIFTRMQVPFSNQSN